MLALCFALHFINPNAQGYFYRIMPSFLCEYFTSMDFSLLQIDNLDTRGVQLAALFMSGVDMALFANDACGQPVPWEHCCPWMYFDGKLLQSKLMRANREKAQLIDLCDGQVASSTPH